MEIIDGVLWVDVLVAQGIATVVGRAGWKMVATQVIKVVQWDGEGKCLGQGSQTITAI